MIPRGSEGIAHLAARIMADLVPGAANAYSMSDLAMIATLMSMTAEDYDRAVEVLIADERDMCEIFSVARAHVADPTLGRRLEAAFRSPPENLRVSHLSARADGAMQVLIDLHALVETARDTGAHWADPLDRQIWSFLERHTERRAYHAAL